MPENETATLSHKPSLEDVSHIDLTPMSAVDHGRVMSVEDRRTGGVFVKKTDADSMGTTYVHSGEAREVLEQGDYSPDDINRAIDAAQTGTSLQIEDLPGGYGHDRRVTVQSAGEKIGGGGKFLGKEGMVELPNGSYIDLKLVQDALLAPVIVVPESLPVAATNTADLTPSATIEAQRAPEQEQKKRRFLRALAAAAALALAVGMLPASTSASQAPDQNGPVAAGPAYDLPDDLPDVGPYTDPTDQEPEQPPVEQAPQETAGWVVESGGGIISELQDELGMSPQEAEASWIAIQPALKQAIAEGKIPADFFYEQNGNLRINKPGPVPREVQTLIEGLLSS